MHVNILAILLWATTCLVCSTGNLLEHDQCLYPTKFPVLWSMMLAVVAGFDVGTPGLKWTIFDVI